VSLKELLYKTIHFLAGFLTAVFIRVHFVLSLLAFLVFFLYEVDEEKLLGDSYFEELCEYGVGLYLAGLIMYLGWL